MAELQSGPRQSDKIAYKAGGLASAFYNMQHSDMLRN